MHRALPVFQPLAAYVCTHTHTAPSNSRPCLVTGKVEPVLGGVPGSAEGQRDLDVVVIGLGGGVSVLGQRVRLGPVHHVAPVLATRAA